jgi:thiamine pyrophosphokinase
VENWPQVAEKHPVGSPANQVAGYFGKASNFHFSPCSWRIFRDRFAVVGKLNSIIENRKRNGGGRVLGILAGDRTPLPFVRRWAESADRRLAADGGANLLLKAGFVPDVAVGDFDSITLDSRQSVPDLRHEPDQSLSDCDKLLRLAIELEYRSITLVGAEGTRVDHMLAVLQSAARASESYIAKCSLAVRVAYEEQIAEVLVGPTEGQRAISGVFSLLPLSRCRGVELRSVEWEISGSELDPLGLTSLSNRSLGRVGYSIGEGAAVLFWGYDGHPFWDEETEDGF